MFSKEVIVVNIDLKAIDILDTWGNVVNDIKNSLLKDCVDVVTTGLLPEITIYGSLYESFPIPTKIENPLHVWSNFFAYASHNKFPLHSPLVTFLRLKTLVKKYVF